MRHDVPPRWAEQLLRIFLRPRDRETIAGDLLEEYRETILPARGPLRARIWYVRQVLSLIDGVSLGIVLGLVFGAWALIGTALMPLADDTPASLAGFYLPMFGIWCLASFAAYRRTGRLSKAIKFGSTVGFVTFAVFDIAIFLRVNLFLDAIRYREDWKNLITRSQSHGYTSIRMYANYEYAMMTPLLLLVASTIGAITGVIGGVLAKSVGSRNQPAQTAGGMP